MKDPIPLINPKGKFVIFTNAKCGGTSVKSWFLKETDFFGLVQSPVHTIYFYGLRFYFFLFIFIKIRLKHVLSSNTKNKNEIIYSNAVIRRAIAFHQRFYSQRKKNLINESAFSKILIARNPYSRVVSAYIDKICGEDKNSNMSQEVVNKNGVNGELTFANFLEYLSSTPEKDQNRHWRRQTYIVDDVKIDYIVRLENLEKEMSDLSSVIGTSNLDSFTTRRQANNYAFEARWDSLDVANSSQVQIIEMSKAIGSFPIHELFLKNKEIRDKIKEIYAKDFELLPYDINF